MRRVVLAVGLVAAFGLAGCLGDGAGPGPSSDPATGSPLPSERLDRGKAPTSLIPAVADLEKAPTWEVGDWWKVEVTGSAGQPVQATAVVTDRHDDTYHVGFAANGSTDEVVLDHWPPQGEVRKDVAWTVRGRLNEPLQFPLEEGKSWETAWWGEPAYTAEVLDVNGTTAKLRVSGQGNNGTYTYDARAGTLTAFRWNGELDYQVLDHGTGYAGEVVVMHGRRNYQAFRAVGVVGSGNSPLPGDETVAGPSDTLEIAEPDASVNLVAGSTVGVQGTSPPGVFRETATTPGGESFTLQTTGTDGLVQTVHHTADAEGTWEFEHVAGGVGVVGVEIVAYEQLNATLGGDATGSP